jgi:hypothetical protein
MSRFAKFKLSALNPPRKFARLPRLGRPANPFKAGTSKTGGRVKRALAAHSALLAANNIPGKAVAAGALGAHLGGPGGAAAAFGLAASASASVAGSALLARSLHRRGKISAYLSRRGQRKTGIYKGWIAAQAEQAQLKKPPRLRNSFRGGSRDLYRAARGIYKLRGFSPMPHNIAQAALAALDQAIAKAGLIRGGSVRTYHRMRAGADRASNRAMAGLPTKSRARYVRAGRFLQRRLNRNTHHTWGIGARGDNPRGPALYKSAAALRLIEKASLGFRGR